ncbi:MAG TPA: carboxylesterase family protein [Candidatus Binataceae bacterium]|nr:carboxylesterase family protein [Candidatus Binataceae bacterium]
MAFHTPIPPVGALRWTPPQPFGRWHGVFEATQFSSSCTQPDGLGGTSGSEDCLTLNIYTPRGRKNQNKHHGLPVMVWIHGGALVTGGGGFYDPTRMIEQGGVIVVTINYRLGLLGFFAHPAIDAEGHLNGNYGLMDQQLALRWVQRNIGAFGGDASRVTIFGESAGGQSVYAHLASPTATGLFQRAIAESGSYIQFQDYWTPISIVPLVQAESVGTSLVPSGTALAASVGCSGQTAECLRGVAASTIVLVEPSTIYPFVDGTILTQTPTAAFASGHFNRVPVISGGNHDEWRLFVADQYDATGHPLTDEADYEAAVDALWSGFGPAFGPFIFTVLYPLANYPIVPPIPGDPNPSPGIALGASGTDGIFACPERNGVQLLAASVTTYAYEFNDENAYLVFNEFPAPLFPPIKFPLGTAHFTEVPYLFDVFSTPSNFTPEQQSLSESMISYWTTFAATGDPNSAGQPLWSPYSVATDEFQSLVAPTPTVETTFDDEHFCSAFWNNF